MPHRQRDPGIGSLKPAPQAGIDNDLIPAILTHRSRRTGEQYYNLASSLDASHAYNNALDAIWKDLGRAPRRSVKQEDKRFAGAGSWLCGSESFLKNSVHASAGKR